MYESPIKLFMADVQSQILKQQDEEIYQAVIRYLPHVDKEELIRALQYDRGQYEKGYADGRNDALDDLVYCENCKNNGACSIQDAMNWTPKINIGDSFCSYGERRYDGNT